MNTTIPPAHSPFVASIAKDIILTIITCGIYNFFIQSRQILALNSMLKTDKYQFSKWLILTFVTCGIYHIYHEYCMAKDVSALLNEPHSNEPILCVVVSAMGLPIVADAIIQSNINRYHGVTSL